MAVDPYVPTRPEDAPRRSVAIPPAAGWLADRPGDIDPAVGSGRKGVLFGTPGPDSGYALTLAEHFHGQITAAFPETVHDAESLAAQVAMRRGGVFGRAPVRADVELGFLLFGWLGDAPAELVEWRRKAAAGVAHDYARRVSLVEAIPEWVIRQRPDQIRERLADWKHLLGFRVAVPGSPYAGA
jgi:hypothetical protein